MNLTLDFLVLIGIQKEKDDFDFLLKNLDLDCLVIPNINMIQVFNILPTFNKEIKNMVLQTMKDQKIMIATLE